MMTEPVPLTSKDDSRPSATKGNSGCSLQLINVPPYLKFCVGAQLRSSDVLVLLPLRTLHHWRISNHLIKLRKRLSFNTGYLVEGWATPAPGHIANHWIDTVAA